MKPAIVGREAELDVVERFLDEVPSGPLALVVEGELGIGKTTLWIDAVRRAEALGYRILQSRPAETEATLSYVALADLLGEAFDVVRPTLPAPQQRALATVLLRAETNDAADSRTTATGVVNVLNTLAADGPLVVAIDDVQWLDPASARALEFAARRLPANIGLVLTRRVGGADQLPLGLSRGLPEDRLRHLVLQPLSFADIHELIASRLEGTPSRPTVARIVDASGGNPFFALEIARAFAGESDQHRAGDPLPMPGSLQQLVLARVRALPGPAQEAALIAAATPQPTIAIVSAMLGTDDDALSALVAAEEAGVLVTEEARIRFTHPLLASAVYRAASDMQRRQLHGRLAEVVVDPEERARHLAASVVDTDEASASELELAARRAALRGAYDAAAELFEASARLTPNEHVEEVLERTLGRACAVFETGDLVLARSLAQRAVADSPTPSVRLHGLSVLGHIDYDTGARESLLEGLEEFLATAADDHDLRRQMGDWVGCVVQLDPGRALELIEPAEQLLSNGGESGRLFDRFWAEALLGRKPRLELLERGLELEENTGPHCIIPTLWFSCTDDFDVARARHEVEDAWWRDRGDDRTRGDRLAYRSLVELRAGRSELAEEYAERSCALIEGLDPGKAHSTALGWRSLVDAHSGRVERARSTLLGRLDGEEQTRSWWDERLLSILGFVEFAAGDYDAADRALTQIRRRYDSVGIREPMLDWSEPVHIEVLVALGELDRARATLLRLEERGRRFPRLWIDVTLPRARALVLAAEGDVPAALAAIEDLDRKASQLPFELGWALLVKGRLLRRLKRRRSAAATLGEALEIFDRLGAPDWAGDARRELARVRPRRRAPNDLTATELRVAELAAAGLTNREVAKAVFISPKTVEANLTRVYRKLRIHSRAELGARMADRVGTAETKRRETPDSAPPTAA